jgi:hypothetical protein
LPALHFRAQLLLELLLGCAPGLLGAQRQLHLAIDDN